MDYSTGELLLGLRYLRNRQDGSVQGLIGELLPGLPYLRNDNGESSTQAIGELLPGLPYLRNEWNAPRLSARMNYCLIYGTSETCYGLARRP